MNKCFRLGYMFGVIMGYGLIYILNIFFDLICDHQYNNNQISNLDNFIINCCESLKTVNIFYIKAIQAASANKDNATAEPEIVSEKLHIELDDAVFVPNPFTALT